MMTSMFRVRELERAKLNHALGAFLAFGVLEAVVAVYAVSHPRETHGLPWTTPLSVGALLLGLALFVSALWRVRAGRIFSLVAIGLLILAVTLALRPIAALPEGPYQIVVHKAERNLQLKRESELIAQYRIGLGPNSVGDKEREGDGKTPEGRFTITDMGPEPFHKWLGLSYPDGRHAWRGRVSGRLTWIEWWYTSFKAAQGKPPFSHTALGGSIGIHGGGSRTDWTLGCIALDNEDVDELYRLVAPGTPVLVFP